MENKSQFTKAHTNIAKGAAMLLMLFDHLYWMGYGDYFAWIKIPQYNDIPWVIGSIGNICVSMFLFLSGYGMEIVSKRDNNYSIKRAALRISKIWVQYAVITLIIVVLDLIFGKIKFSPAKILLNVFALDFTYNNFAWFMLVYIVVMLIFPLLNKVMRNSHWIVEIIIIIAIKCGITVIYSAISHFINIPKLVYSVCIEPFMFVPVFLIGYMMSKHHVMETVHQKVFAKFEKTKLLILLAATFTFMILVPATIFDNITAPILCFGFAYMFSHTKIQKAFDFIGKHSTNMWLIHFPIMVTLLNWLVYLPEYWLLILAWLIILMIPLCYGIDKCMNVILGRK